MDETNAEANATELSKLKEQFDRLNLENEQNKVFRHKYINVIGKLSEIGSPASVNAPTTDVVTNTNKLLDNAESILSNVVSSFKDLPQPDQQNIMDIKEEGSKFLHKITMLEQRCSHLEYNTRLVGSKVQDIEQYLKLNHLLIHGLRDIPLKDRGFKFTRYVADKIKYLLPELPYDADYIYNCISVSHPIKSKKTLTI